MKKIVVNGKAHLNGKLTVGGSKNAALPIIFACILTKGVSEIKNVPDIGDVRVALKILAGFGGEYWRRADALYIDTTHLTYRIPDRTLVGMIRASTYLIGACLSRFGRCRLMPFGGCNFSLRPIDMHLDACRALGAEVTDTELSADRLRGGVISFDKPSVGATVNALLLSAGAEGETIIRGFAREPHIDALIDFLISCGADILRTDDEIHIQGRELHGGRITVIGDMIEAGSYLALGIATGGRVEISNMPLDNMSAILKALSDIEKSTSPTRIVAMPYPEFPTDLQPIFAALMATKCGGEIVDTVWKDRFGYLSEFPKFNIKYKAENSSAVIYPSKITPAIVTAPDLRGGFTYLVLALCADGRSEIHSAEIILRGYERLVEKFRDIGADIDIIDY